MDRDDWQQADDDARDLARWFDGELAPDRRDAVEGRLGRDSEAAQSIEFYRLAREVIQARPRPAAPAGFANRVMRAVRTSGVEPLWEAVLPFARRMAVAASVLLLLSIGMTLRMQSETRRPSVQTLAAGLPRSTFERTLLGEEWGPIRAMKGAAQR